MQWRRPKDQDLEQPKEPGQAPGQNLPADKANQLKPPQLWFIYGHASRWPLN